MRLKEQNKLRHGGRKHLPVPMGPHPVGCVDIMTGLNREGSFLRLYYPSAPQGNALEKELQWPNWLPHAKYLNGYAKFLRVWKPFFKAMYRFTIGNIYVPAVWDAEPAIGYFPVIIFSHGLASCRTSYTTICLELASHGYIVAAVEHRDRSACHSYFLKESKMLRPGDNDSDKSKSEHEYSYPEGWDTESGTLHHKPRPVRQWVYYQTIPMKKTSYPERHEQLKLRSKECLLALDLLTTMNSGETVENVLDPFFKASRFKGIMDLSRPAIGGHSFGSATVLLTLAIDKRFKLGLALDTWMLPLTNCDNVLKEVTQPILFVNMEKFQSKSNLKMLSKLESDSVERKFVTVKRSVHLDQCDMPFVCGPFSYKVLSGFSCVNPLTVIDITTRLMLEFLGKHLDYKIETDWEKYLTKQEKKLKRGINPKLKMPLQISS